MWNILGLPPESLLCWCGGREVLHTSAMGTGVQGWGLNISDCQWGCSWHWIGTSRQRNTRPNKSSSQVGPSEPPIPPTSRPSPGGTQERGLCLLPQIRLSEEAETVFPSGAGVGTHAPSGGAQRPSAARLLGSASLCLLEHKLMALPGSDSRDPGDQWARRPQALASVSAFPQMQRMWPS